MTALGLCTALVMAAVLFWAGLAKITRLGGMATTLQALGVPARWSRRASALVPITEVATAVGVVFAPSSTWALGAVVAVGGAFALAGLVALLRKERVPCHCFGPSAAGGQLGRTQVLTLPVWVGGAWALHHGISGPLPPVTSATLFAAAGLAVATLQAVLVRGVVREARGDRLSAEEMYLWLPRH